MPLNSDPNPNNTALISVHIPYSSLSTWRANQKTAVKLIADRTGTHIESYDLSHLLKTRFCIFGKWRDCLQAGRLLWYHMIRPTTVYIHSDWDQELNRPMKDQNQKPFRHLYRNVKFSASKEFNLISISGICWDVLKVRREIFKRSDAKPFEQINGSKTELIALQVLNSIRADINDDIHCPESIYSIRGSQLLHLITGFRNQTFDTNDSKERQLEANHSEVMPLSALKSDRHSTDTSRVNNKQIDNIFALISDKKSRGLAHNENVVADSEGDEQSLDFGLQPEDQCH